MKLVWIHDSNSNSMYGYLNVLYLFCPKQRTNIALTCMEIVQMDSLNFSDNFSYIIYLVWSYGWFYIIFRSLGYFLKFINHFLIYFNSRNTYCVSIASLWRQQVNRCCWWSNLTSGVHWSVTGLIRVYDRWVRSTDTSVQSTLTCGPHFIKLI